MKSKLDHINIASQIYTRLEREYGFAHAKGHTEEQMVEQTMFLASQLARHTDLQVKAWERALDVISNEGNDFPPKIPKLLKIMRAESRHMVEMQKINLKLTNQYNEIKELAAIDVKI